MRHRQIVLTAIAAFTVTQAQAADKPHNLILFVPDGMRAKMVTPETAPTMAAIRDQGINFQNSHSMFPTFTMPNSSAMATGHWIGDTGVFSNADLCRLQRRQYRRHAVARNDTVQGSLDQHNGGNFLNYEEAQGTRYFDTAGFPGRTMGLYLPNHRLALTVCAC